MNILQKINEVLGEGVGFDIKYHQKLLFKIKQLWTDLYDSDREHFVYKIFQDYNIQLTDEEKKNQDITKLESLNSYDLKDIYEMMGGE